MDTRSNRIQNSFLRTEDQRDMLKKSWFICEFFGTIFSSTYYKRTGKTALLMFPAITYFVQGNII